MPSSVRRARTVPSSVRRRALTVPSSVRRARTVPSSVRRARTVPSSVRRALTVPSSVRRARTVPSSVRRARTVPSSVRRARTVPSSVRRAQRELSCVRRTRRMLCCVTAGSIAVNGKFVKAIESGRRRKLTFMAQRLFAAGASHPPTPANRWASRVIPKGTMHVLICYVQPDYHKAGVPLPFQRPWLYYTCIITNRSRRLASD